MSKQTISVDASKPEEPARPIIYKAFEYVKPSSHEDYVLVREYRTLYYLDGRVTRETVLMESPFEQMVHAFDGTMRKIDGLLTGLFNAPEQAQECARKIDYLYGKAVEVNGNQLSMAL
jgi:hypothetical protein